MAFTLSIITINYNNASGLEKTIDSIATQKSENFEHIIIDGGSNDGSVQVIEKFLQNERYKKHLRYWKSERDGGIYDAMNRGIPHATGKYILMLNSGDYFKDENAVERATSQDFAEDLVYFDATFVGKDGTKIYRYPDSISAVYFVTKLIFNQQNLLVRTEFQKENLFSTKFKIAGDYEFYLRSVIKNNCTLRHVSDSLVCFEMDTGLGSRPETIELRAKEGREITNMYLPPRVWQDLKEYSDFVYGYKGLLPKFRKILRKIAKFTTRRKLPPEKQ